MEQLEIKKEFKNRRQKQLLISVPLIPAIFAIAFLGDAETELISGLPNLYLVIIAGALIIFGLVFSLINWRCPKCKTYLGKRFNPKYCSNCGTELR